MSMGMALIIWSRKDMKKEKDFVYLVTVIRITLSLIFGLLYFYEK